MGLNVLKIYSRYIELYDFGNSTMFQVSTINTF